MNSTFVSTATVRQRGQLTIPDSLREKVDWLSDNSVVAVTADSPDQITIRPYHAIKHDAYNWRQIWENINLARSFKGKRGNLSEFVIKDRKQH